MPVGSTVRVFISSTFRDMHAERDYLSRIVFPELRSRCLKRGVDFVGLDLRWGVTEEESRERGALAICLEEIEKCRPFFVCLLGDRYGWVPPPEEVPRELYEHVHPTAEIAQWYGLDETTTPAVYRMRRLEQGVRLPEGLDARLAEFWREHGLPHAGDSITAREILRGVFERGYPKTHALFYLRQSGVHTHPRFPAAFVPVFVEQDPDRHDRLTDLKAMIAGRREEMVVRDYPATYSGLRIDPALLPPTLSDQERDALKDGVIRPDEWGSLGVAVTAAVNEHGTVALDAMEELGNLVLDDLWKAIEAGLEETGAAPLDEHQRERAYHERFVRDRRRLFLGRAEELEWLLEYAERPDDPSPAVVTGPAGSGKSALLAVFATLLRGEVPEEAVRIPPTLSARFKKFRDAHSDALVLPHFIGAAPGSTDLNATLRSICEELRRRADLADEVPLDPNELRRHLAKSLEAAGAKQPVILILDALNQLDPAGYSLHLGWLPFQLTPGVKVIVSALGGDVLDRLKARVPQDHVRDVPGLPGTERERLVREHLALRRKKLSDTQLQELLDERERPDSELPLYLVVALEELSLFGDFEKLPDRIHRLPPSLAELFQQVLERLEHDHGRDMAEAICRWLAASRSGLLETEVLELLRTRARDLPTVRWTRFYRSLEFYLRPVEEETGAGLLDFYHDQLRFAVFQRYLAMTSLGAERTAIHRQTHEELATYFRSICCLEGENGQPPRWHPDRLPEGAIPPERWPDPVWEKAREAKSRARGLAELPYHLTEGERWDGLHAVLTDLSFLEAKCTYVGQIETGAGAEKHTVYAGVYELQEDYRRALEVFPAG